MKLHWSPRSPFVRKVMITLHETGLVGQVDCIRSVVAYAAVPNEAVLADNPLGKIPALVLDDGTALYDSRVICEYLDTLHGGRRLLPETGRLRFTELRRQALADGMLDIMLMWRNEQIRPSGPYDVVTSAFARKLRAAFAALDSEAEDIGFQPFGLGAIAIVCAIGQLDFRFANNHWREAFPCLAAWHGSIAHRPSVLATAAVDDPSPAKVRAGFDPDATLIDFLDPA